MVHCAFSLYVALALNHRFPGDVYHSCCIHPLSRINPITGVRVPQRATEPTGPLRCCMKHREGSRECVYLLSSSCLPEVKENA